jgi:hypothetical protein
MNPVMVATAMLATAEPDYPPQESASSLLDGEMRYGSTGQGYGATGQLWVAHNGEWVRTNEEPSKITGLLGHGAKMTLTVDAAGKRTLAFTLPGGTNE